jgi:uncharacterized protein YkwD
MSSIERALRLATLALMALVAACGGGGGGGAGSDPTPAPAPGPAPATVEADCGLPDFSARLLARINTARASGASCGSAGSFASAGALGWHGRLVTAATGHTQDMVTADFFSHTGSDGSTVGQRVTAAGYAWSAVGENIAAGYGSVDAVMDGWLASPGHCANLLNPQFTHVGVACLKGAAGNDHGAYWTMNLARPR